MNRESLTGTIEAIIGPWVKRIIITQSRFDNERLGLTKKKRTTRKIV